MIEPLDVHAHDPVEVFFSCALDRAYVRDAGVVDKDREPLPFKDLVKKRLYLLLVSNITSVGGCVPTLRDNLPAGCLGIVEIDVEDADGCPVGGKLSRDRTSNSTATTCNNGNFPIGEVLITAATLMIQSETPRFQGMKSV